MEKIKCTVCGESFKSNIDLEAHLYNNNHCNPPITCPECLQRTTQTELNTFGGLCEECSSFID
jgi:hypothetical protein